MIEKKDLIEKVCKLFSLDFKVHDKFIVLCPRNTCHLTPEEYDVLSEPYENIEEALIDKINPIIKGNNLTIDIFNKGKLFSDSEINYIKGLKIPEFENIMQAVCDGNISFVKYCITTNGNINFAYTHNGIEKSFVKIAIEHNQLEMAHELLNLGENVLPNEAVEITKAYLDFLHH